MKKKDKEIEIEIKDEENNNENDHINDGQPEVNQDNESETANEEAAEASLDNELIKVLEEKSKEDLINDYINLQKNYDKDVADMEKHKEDAATYLDRYKRTLADMENLRKRTAIDKQDSLKYANFNIIGDLLVILDDFQRAIESARNDEGMDLKHFVDGIEMTEKQFIDLLYKKYGVKKYGDVDDEFDPNIHEAMMAEIGDFEHEVVLEVFRKGYSLHDRVIRAAQVKIGKPE